MKTYRYSYFMLTCLLIFLTACTQNTAVPLTAAQLGQGGAPKPPAAASNGGESSGGGIVFLCPDRDLGERVLLADTFKLSQSGNSNFLKEQDETDESSAASAILQTIGGVDSGMAATLRQNLKMLVFKPVDSLSLLGDDDIREIPEHCKKAQLAVQHFATGIVDYNQSYFSKLSSVERALFKLHEAYVKIYGSNSHEVRNKVSQQASSHLFTELLRPSTAMVKNEKLEKFSQIMANRHFKCEVSTQSEVKVDKAYLNLFPIKIRVTDFGQGKVLFSVTTRGDNQFSPSGDSLAVEYSQNWLLFQGGDDDWYQLHLNLDVDSSDPTSKSPVPGIFNFLRDDGVIENTFPVVCELVQDSRVR